MLDLIEAISAHAYVDASVWKDRGHDNQNFCTTTRPLSIPPSCSLLRMPDVLVRTGPTFMLYADHRLTSVPVQYNGRQHIIAELLYDFELDRPWSNPGLAQLSFGMLDMELGNEDGKFDLCCIVGSGMRIPYFHNEEISGSALSIDYLESHGFNSDRSAHIFAVSGHRFTGTLHNNVLVAVLKVRELPVF